MMMINITYSPYTYIAGQRETKQSKQPLCYLCYYYYYQRYSTILIVHSILWKKY